MTQDASVARFTHINPINVNNKWRLNAWPFSAAIRYCLLIYCTNQHHLTLHSLQFVSKRILKIH